MDMSKQRTVYIKPAIEIIEIENEGVIASSGLIGGSQGNPGVYSSSYRRGLEIVGEALLLLMIWRI